MISIDIVIPAYNEEQILETSARRVLAFCQKKLTEYNWSIVLLVNGATDNSPKIAQSLALENNHFKAIILAEGGLSRSLRRYWSASPADILVYMDSDLAVGLEALPRLINPLAHNQAEIVWGNRFNKKSKVQRKLSREIISRGYNFFARLILGLSYEDLQCGFKGARHNAWRQLASYIVDNGWLFGTELLAWADYFNFKIIEIPVEWQETRLGQRPSKVHLLSIPQKFIKPLWQLKNRLKSQKTTNNF